MSSHQRKFFSCYFFIAEKGIFSRGILRRKVFSSGIVLRWFNFMFSVGTASDTVIWIYFWLKLFCSHKVKRDKLSFLDLKEILGNWKKNLVFLKIFDILNLVVPGSKTYTNIPHPTIFPKSTPVSIIINWFTSY